MGILTEEQVAKLRAKYPVKKKKIPAPSYNSRECFAGRTRLHCPNEHLETFVYFIQGEQTRNIKIGYTTNLQSRIDSFQLGCPDKLFYIGTILFPTKARAENVEKQLHKKFAHLRVQGEWFYPDPSLIVFIKKHLKDDDDLAAALV